MHSDRNFAAQLFVRNPSFICWHETLSLDTIKNQSKNENINLFADSEVVFPSDSNPNKWLHAKGRVEGSAIQHCQSKIHLGGIHFVVEVYCLSFRRHLSSQHPLYDFFKYHCEGTVPHIKVAFKSVTEVNNTGIMIFIVLRIKLVYIIKVLDGCNFKIFNAGVLNIIIVFE